MDVGQPQREIIVEPLELPEPRRAPKANCHTGHDHAAPALQCRCGYWSFKTRELLEEALESYAVSVDVIGQVEIWGAG